MSTLHYTLTSDQLKEVIHYDLESGIFRWRVNVSSTGRAGNITGAKTKAGYIVIRLNRRLYLAHRLAWLYVNGEFPPNLIDHIDLNKSNNRWANLRLCTKSGNSQNRVKAQSNNKKSGLLGIYYSAANRQWGAKIVVNKKQHHGGFYDTPEAAHNAYINLKRELHPFGML